MTFAHLLGNDKTYLENHYTLSFLGTEQVQDNFSQITQRIITPKFLTKYYQHYKMKSLEGRIALLNKENR